MFTFRRAENHAVLEATLAQTPKMDWLEAAVFQIVCVSLEGEKFSCVYTFLRIDSLGDSTDDIYVPTVMMSHHYWCTHVLAVALKSNDNGQRCPATNVADRPQQFCCIYVSTGTLL